MIEPSIVKEVFLPNRESCFECLRKLRWPDGVRCPYCGASRIHKDGYTDKGAANYHCLNCGRYQWPHEDNIWALPIEEMFYILKEMENKSTLQISKELGRKYDSVLAFVREMQEIAEKIEGKISLKDLVEIDEIYITAGEKGIKQDRPRRRGLRRRG